MNRDLKFACRVLRSEVMFWGVDLSYVSDDELIDRFTEMSRLMLEYSIGEVQAYRATEIFSRETH